MWHRRQSGSHKEISFLIRSTDAPCDLKEETLEFGYFSCSFLCHSIGSLPHFLQEGLTHVTRVPG